MSSSELSNALNPDVVQRPRRRHAAPSGPSTSTVTATPVLQPPIPHRSELELAIVPPPQSAVSQVTPEQHAVQQPPRNANPVLELCRVVATAREAAAVERQRRIAWEREQEAKQAQREMEMERQILEMRQELTLLKAYISMQPHIPQTAAAQGQAFVNTIPTTAHIEPASPSAEPSPQTPLSPISPVPQHPQVQQPMFVEGSSTRPLASVHPPSPSQGFTHLGHSSLSVLSPPSSTAPSPQVAPAIARSSSFLTESSEGLAPPTPQSTGPSVTPVPRSPRPEPSSRKRPRHVLDDNDELNDESEDSDDATSDGPRERRNGHDSRCLTIHHAMRIHIRKMMQLGRDDELPESHFEGAPISADQPVRFVWNKTTKQSAHNAAMKRRIVNDVKANRTSYKHVPDKDFHKKTLETVFDQVFTTLRQKFKAQKDATAATRLQRRENNKALKARRLQRKKAKLSNRVDARKKIDAFAQPVFETALHQDCMSSEESDGEYIENGEKVQVFRTRGPSWRSARLRRYYAILDEQDRIEKSMKPKRGLGRRVRREGPPKEGLFLPPKGVAPWMVSKRWLQETEMTRPDLADALRELIVDVDEQENEVARVILGEDESEDESAQGPPAAEVYAHVSDTSYSLQNALQPL
ncbi:hypothetical protein BV20DRAFT_959504 [Pilatotrama ljubarskyi]|nr:hypothetical protein BV20DRAFT_959504 [Pilatotrama ljubarskyi]